MKADKELLQLAAKAAGYNVKAMSVDIDDNFDGLIVGDKNTKQKVWWNPLLNDGNALRLAVDLGLDVFCNQNDDHVFVYAYELQSRDFIAEYSEIKDGDKRAATRRAIVRAAAAIGEYME